MKNITSLNLIFLLFLSLNLSLIIFSQTPSPSPAPQSCPVLESLSYTGWSKNITVYYDVSSITDPKVREAFEQAAAAWTTANAANGSNVVFSPSQGPNAVGEMYRLDFQIGDLSSIPERPAAAIGDTTIYAGIKVEQSIIYDPNAVYVANNALQADPNQPNYESFLEKLFRHEIGHTMGIGHNKTGCGGGNNSVMNYGCGTNDNGGNGFTSSMPNQITTCD